MQRIARDTLRLLRDPVLFVWGSYLVLFPVYVFSSGLPQPGDWLILLLAPLAFRRWDGRIAPGAARTLRQLLVFTGYVLAINLLWSMMLGTFALSPKTGFAMSPIFYIYNALVFLVALVLHRTYGSNLLYLTGRMVLFTLVLQVVLATLLRGDGRSTGLFNNPNQLGYYALLSASMLMVLQRRRYISTVAMTVGTLAATYLCLLSASKAALGAIGLLVIAGMFTRLRTMLLTAVAFGALLTVAQPVLDAVTGAISRIEEDESHQFGEERGYDRIVEYPEYWVIGSGEGAYARFKDTSAIGAHEIHSSLGTLFFCYGIVGVGLFIAFVFGVLQRTGLRTWLVMMPAFAYGMTHQGLRFTLLWVFFALVVCLREEARADRQATRVAISSATLAAARPRS